MARFRSLLFAPGAQSDLIRKLAASGADAVAIDLEDATPLNAKEEGRDNARLIGAELVADGRVAVYVRVNGFGTPWFDRDIESGLPEGLAGVFVPKAVPRDLGAVGAALDAAGKGQVSIVAGLETAAGVVDAREILAHPLVSAGYFGAEDFIADMGGRRTDGNLEVLHARSSVVLAGRVTDTPVLDQVTVAYRDDERFSREAAEAQALGYAGKMCIHPAQVVLANAIFTPTDEEVARAQAMIDAYAAAGDRGEGVIVIDGEMIDEALVAQARRVVEAAD